MSDTSTGTIDFSSLDHSLSEMIEMGANNAEFQVGVAGENIKMNAYNKLGQRSVEAGK